MNVSSVVLVIALAAGRPAAAQSPAQTPPATPAAPAPQAPGAVPAPVPSVPASRMFTADSGVMFSVINPAKVADFEAVMLRIKEALAKSTDPKRKQQALGWRVFKGVEAGPGGNVVYVSFFDPPVKDAEYSVTDILREAFPNEAQDLWAKYVACFVQGQVMLNLKQVVNMSPALVPK
jgi:hypothetical protein